MALSMMKALFVLFVLLLGLAGGLAGGYYGGSRVDRLLGADEVEGIVTEERREDDRLVITMRAGDETIMASFVDRADDVAEMVGVGDALTIRRVTSGRGLFADDVPIVRLRRAADIAPAEPEPRRRRRGHHGDEEDASAASADATEGAESAEGAEGLAREGGAEEEHPATAPEHDAPAASHGAHGHRES